MTIPVRIELSQPLLAAFEAAPENHLDRVGSELSELLHDLAVTDEPSVRIEAANGSAAPGGVAVFVYGRRCRFPEVVIAEALAYVEGTARVPLDAPAALGRLDAEGDLREHLPELVATVARAALSAQPEILLEADTDPVVRAAVALGLPIRHEGTSREATDGGDPAEALIASLADDTIEIAIEPAYLRGLSLGPSSLESFPFLRDGLFVELGLLPPPFRFRRDESLRPNGFAVRINAVWTMPRIGLPAGSILVNDTVERLDVLGIEAEATLNPATGQPGSLVAAEHGEALEAAGLTTWDPLGFLVLTLAAVVRRKAHALMTRDVAGRMARDVGWIFPFLGDVAQKHVPDDLLAPVLRELLLDGVPVRNLRRILELLLRFDSGESGGPDRMSFVRAGLSDAIAHKVARGTETVVVYLLDPEIEAAVDELGDAMGPARESVADRVAGAVRSELAYLPPTALVPALLTRDELRRPVRDLIRHEFPRLTVLGFGDLPPSYNVQPVARVLDVTP
jgi:type III secretion protein V